VFEIAAGELPCALLAPLIEEAFRRDDPSNA
jgi:hypothetical protein